MKISYDWIKSHINTDLPVAKIDELLTKSGLEVEGVEEFSTIKGGLENVVVGEVLTCEKHADADKLSVTTVDVGSEVLPIVCGAPNVAKGQKVIVATVGAVLYPINGEEFKIKKAKIRGEVSQGMICAEDELGIGKSHDGIMVLDTEVPNGTPAIEVLDVFNDEVLEIGLTPNRADGASHYGVARDLKVLLKQDLKTSFPDLSNNATDSDFEIIVDNEEACPRYCGVVIQGVKVEESPQWLKNRLLSIGLSPINNIVDITNFILHDLGQPLHAFDADKISSKKVRITTLAQGTPFVTLDEKERKLNSFDLMICDDKAPMCIAGVFGGVDSGTTEQTQAIFLESAYFSPEYVRQTAQAHGLKTDASFRFERGTDPEMPLKALHKATELIIDMAGGKVTSGFMDHYPKPIPAFETTVSIQRVNQLIGTDLSKAAMLETLGLLEIKVLEDQGDEVKLEIPAYRVDVQREADIAEEVLRIYGYDNIPLTNNLATSFSAPSNQVDAKENMKHSLSHLLANRGFNEIFTNSLTKPDYTSDIEEINDDSYVHILNRLSEELGVMRQTNLFTGLEVLAYNINRKNTDLSLFEYGKTYLKDEAYEEEEILSLFMTGNQTLESWVNKANQVSVYDLINNISLVLEKTGYLSSVSKRTVKNSVYDTCLELFAGEKVFARLGQVKAKHVKKLGIQQDVFYAEVYLELLKPSKASKVVYKEASKFPPVRRDLSIVIDKQVNFDQIESIAFGVNRKLIKAVNVFDVFEGKPLEEGKKSYSVSFTLQDDDKTLNDKVIDKTMNRLISVYENDLGAVIRK